MRNQKPDRLVIDTNIIVSAAINGKFEERISLSAIHSIEIFTCAKQISELKSTFSKPSVRKFLSESP